MTVAVSSPVAFINMPYAARYERVYLAFIAGLAAFGMVPTAAVNDPSSQFQLDRIFNLVASSDYSFHDLSHMSLDRVKPRTPRFNMPFELGLAVATARLKNPNHQWFVFDTERFRVAKALSDLGGVTVRVHNRSPDSILRCLMNALDREHRKPSLRDLEAVFSAVERVAHQLKLDLGGDLFDARPFRELSYVALQAAARFVRPGGT
ncbi:MAG: hypothetical protein ACXWH7_04710 [Thermoanaerobaculia bacterium]